MSELEIRKDQTPAAAAPPEMSALAQWARDADEAFRIAGMLAGTSFVPESLRNQQDLTAAILTGQELGLPPMAALRGMDVIYGVPALRAHLMRGLVQSHGHDIEVLESTDKRCVVRGRRKGATDWQTVEWTIERATKLLGALKNQWVKQPTTMLIARATGEICRLIAADVLYAAPYAAEELDDMGRPAPVVTAAPVTAAEILGEADPDKGDDESSPSEQVGSADAEAAAQYAAEQTGEPFEVNGWPPVRNPGSGVSA